MSVVLTDMEYLGSGKANDVYKVAGGVLRKSKTEKPCAAIVKNWQLWQTRLGPYMGDMKIVHHAKLGEVIMMDHYGKNDSMILELKPKWLTQSPDAPPNARSCRTCAIKTMRNQELKWCPLQLAARSGIGEVTDLFRDAGAKDPLQCAEYVISNDLIDRLIAYQIRAPSVKQVIAEAEPSTRQMFLEAMTVRDCTIIFELVGEAVQARLVDLDPKDPAKLEKWARLEAELQSFYILPSPVCLLSRLKY